MNRTNRPRLSRISGSSYASKLLGRAGDGSTLTLDFTTGVLDPRLTFSRDGGGTYIGNDGKVYGVDFATSSSLAIGTGSKSVTLTATAGVDRRYLVGQTVWISNGANNMRGPVTAYNASTQVLTIEPTGTSGSGSFTSWTVGNASARFDYDPTTLAPKGLLIEGSATSLTRSSQDLTNASYWTLQSAYASTSATGGTAPDGTNTGNLFTEPSTNAQRSIYQSYSSAAGTYTFSVWLKAGSGSTRYMRLVVSSGASDFGYVTINMSTGAVQQTATVVGTATNASAVVSAEYTATGWRRYSLTVTLAASVNFAFLVPMDLASIDTPTINFGRVAYLGNGSSFLIWGAMLEQGSGASSYIPTGASQGTRARDECSITGGSFSSWFTNPNEGSFFVQYSMNYPSASMGAGIDRYAFELSDSSGSSRALCIAAYRNAPPGQNVRVFNPSVTSFDSGDTLTTSAALNTKFAFGYATANNYIAAVGVAQAFQTYNTGSLPTSPAINQMWLGSNRNLSSPTYLFGCIRTIKYWPTRLPNATLQGLVS